MRLHQAPSDREAESSAVAGGASLLAPECHVEAVGGIGGWDPAAGIHDRDVRRVLLRSCLDRHRPVCGGVSNCVLQDVAQGSEHLRGRGRNLGRGIDDSSLEMHTLGGRDWRRAGECVGDEIP